MISGRVERVAKELARRELDAIIVTEPTSRYYLTGWKMDDTQVGELAYWVLAGPDSLTILTGQNNLSEAIEAAPGSKIIGIAPQDRGKNASMIAALIQEAGYKRVGIDDVHLGANYYLQLTESLPPHIELTPAADLIRTVRAVKEPGEIELLREAIRLTDEAYMALREWITAGTTEKQVAWFLERHMRDRGADGIGFGTIVAAGPAGAVPHHEPTDRPIEAGEPVVLDFGGTYEGYTADLTRTFCIGEPRDQQLIDIHTAVLASLTRGMAALRAGDRCDGPTAVATHEVESRGFTVSHPGGHGIGLQIHELPTGPMVLRENMVMTFEPAVYIDGWGGVRIEDNVLITADGPVVLTMSPHDLVI